MEGGPFLFIGLTMFLCFCPLPSPEAEWNQGTHHQLKVCPLLGLLLLSLILVPTCYCGTFVQPIPLHRPLKGQAWFVCSSDVPPQGVPAAAPAPRAVGSRPPALVGAKSSHDCKGPAALPPLLAECLGLPFSPLH